MQIMNNYIIPISLTHWVEEQNYPIQCHGVEKLHCMSHQPRMEQEQCNSLIGWDINIVLVSLRGTAILSTSLHDRTANSPWVEQQHFLSKRSISLGGRTLSQPHGGLVDWWIAETQKSWMLFLFKLDFKA